MTIPTEPIGSIPRPEALIDAVSRLGPDAPDVQPLYDAAIVDTLRRFEATGSPVITDGEQRKYHNFWTYAVDGSPDTAPDGFRIPFAAGHTRRMPKLVRGPFRYRVNAAAFVRFAKRHTSRPYKQAVISPSALSLMYPAEGVPGYTRETFIDDLLSEHEREIRACFAEGADSVQIDFTEARLAMKIDPSGELLTRFIELNNLALSRFSFDERRRIGVHTCPGGDRDSTHSADVDYAELLPSLFQLDAGRFYVALAGEREPARALDIMRRHSRPDQQIFVGVVAPIDPDVEPAQLVMERTLEAASHLGAERIGTTDDCGFSPFCDDLSTSRDKAFEKIRSRVEGTAQASRRLGVP